jgi:hypothetical protein
LRFKHDCLSPEVVFCLSLYHELVLDLVSVILDFFCLSSKGSSFSFEGPGHLGNLIMLFGYLVRSNTEGVVNLILFDGKFLLELHYLSLLSTHLIVERLEISLGDIHSFCKIDNIVSFCSSVFVLLLS